MALGLNPSPPAACSLVGCPCTVPRQGAGGGLKSGAVVKKHEWRLQHSAQGTQMTLQARSLLSRTLLGTLQSLWLPDTWLPTALSRSGRAAVVKHQATAFTACFRSPRHPSEPVPILPSRPCSLPQPPGPLLVALTFLVLPDLSVPSLKASTFHRGCPKSLAA